MIELKDRGFPFRVTGVIRRIGDGSIIQRIQSLFEGHSDLLNKFSMFLPPDSGIDLSKGQVMAPPMPAPMPSYNNASVYGVLCCCSYVAISRMSSKLQPSTFL